MAVARASSRIPAKIFLPSAKLGSGEPGLGVTWTRVLSPAPCSRMNRS